MPKLIRIFLLLTTTGCVTARYDLNISAQYSDYSEPYNNGNPTVTQSKETFKSSAPGLQIGIMETTNAFFAELGALYYSHGGERVNYYSGATPSSYDVSLTRMGLYGRLGLNLWWFRPYYTFSGIKNNYSSSNQELLDQLIKDSVYVDGWGLIFVIPYSESMSFVAGYETLNAEKFYNQNGTLSRYPFD